MRAGGRTDKTKLIVAFRSSAVAPKKCEGKFLSKSESAVL